MRLYLTFCVCTVDDVNDNPPQFEQRSYRCVLSEDAKRGQFVTMVTATDPDVSDQTRLVYSLTGGNDQQMFNIDSKRGMDKLSLDCLNTQLELLSSKLWFL